VFVDRVKLLDPLFRDGRMGRLPLVDVAFAARMMNEQGAELETEVSGKALSRKMSKLLPGSC
jgi:hypothetical protein